MPRKMATVVSRSRCSKRASDLHGGRVQELIASSLSAAFWVLVGTEPACRRACDAGSGSGCRSAAPCCAGAQRRNQQRWPTPESEQTRKAVRRGAVPRQELSQRDPPAASGRTARTAWPARSADRGLNRRSGQTRLRRPARPSPGCTFVSGCLAGGIERGVALGVPLLHALLADLVGLGARLAQAARHTRRPWLQPGPRPCGRLPWRLQSARGAWRAPPSAGPGPETDRRTTSTMKSSAVGMAPIRSCPSCWRISCMECTGPLRLVR